METMIEVRQLCKSSVTNKRQNHVLHNVDLPTHKGEFIAVMRPSGSGKSTLLYTISNMDHINSGTAEFGHKGISKYNEMEMAKLRLHEMGFILQRMHFLNNLNTYDNAILPGYMVKKRKRKEINAYADELLRKSQTTSIAGHSIQEVSGGELQCACIARAMINQPRILLADESTGVLNSSNAREVMDMFLKIHERGTTILMVTHDVKMASYEQCICYINDGKIESSLDTGMLKHTDKLKRWEKKVYNWLVEKGWQKGGVRMIDILVVEDNDEPRDVLEWFLLHEGFQTHCAQWGDDALTLLQQERVCLLLVDIMLQDMDSFRICTETRQSNNPPIIIMSVRAQTSDQSPGYELGADGYAEKPFAMAVMLAKIKAQLRRGYKMQEERNVLRDDDLLVDIERRNVTLRGKQLALSVKKFELLALLLRKRHTTLRKGYISS